MNKNYITGRRKEYKIVKELKEQGYDLCQRSAGSHSEVDIFAIKKSDKTIRLIQAKPKGFNSKKIEEEMSWLSGKFSVVFEVI